MVNTQVIGANDETTLMIMEYSIMGSIIILGLLGLYAFLRLIQNTLRVIFRRRVSLIMTIIGVSVIILILYFAIPAISQITASMGQDPIVGTWKAYESITGTQLSDTITFYSDGTFYNKKYQSPLFVSPYVQDISGTWVKENTNYYELTWTESGQSMFGSSNSVQETSQLYYYPDSNTFVFPNIISGNNLGLYPPDVEFQKEGFNL
jgi:asparagine N-glycosylation enzyme membrane subunit Stt3